MPSLMALRGSAVAFVLLTAGVASAGEAPNASPSTSTSAQEGRFRASIRAGYGAVFTTGLSYLGTGAGLSIAYAITPSWVADATLLGSQGESIRASNQGNGGFVYQSSYSSIQSTLGAAYTGRMGPLRIRPGVRAGLSFVDGRTKLGASTMRDEHRLPIVGPHLEITVRLFSRFEVGVDGEAFFLPTWVAAPTAGLYGVAGAVF